MITAIAAGIAGTIALSERKTDTLVGVVAALALVPAGAAAAIAFLSQDPTEGWGGLLLLAINVVLIVVAGVFTLLCSRLAESIQTRGQMTRPDDRPDDRPEWRAGGRSGNRLIDCKTNQIKQAEKGDAL